MKLTTTQNDTLRAIRQYHAEHGFAPTIRELCALTGVRSTSHMHYILNQLEGLGWIDREPGIARTVRLTSGPPKRRAAPAPVVVTPRPIRIPPRAPAYHGPRGSRG